MFRWPKKGNWKRLERKGIYKGTTDILTAIYGKHNIVQTNWWIFSSQQFSCSVDVVIKKAKQKMRSFWLDHCILEKVELTLLLFVDEKSIIAYSEYNWQHNLNIQNDEPKQINIKTNVNKTKTMITSASDETHITLRGYNMEQVRCFKYLRTIVKWTIE